MKILFGHLQQNVDLCYIQLVLVMQVIQVIYMPEVVIQMKQEFLALRLRRFKKNQHKYLKIENNKILYI